ncbi:LytR/AlgR family response regulator transcription factor [Amphibacillus jilinensis]|uniref:LytR/AlgR family response regulator transcription factor n=1 Tax=Amphibacillus jilinensis TaxID=1216008 RepID=UPI0002D29678|nr:LytTR family DNA-binding domain-containing protein [Amphibacillus jilinensis]
MMRVAVVEDEINYQKQLIEYIERFEQESEESIDIETFSDGDAFINSYKAQFDLILMDIQMPLMDGMSTAEEIRKIDLEVVIIFITNMTQYAIKGYAVDALDYVLKPISYFSLSERLKRAINRMKKREARFVTIRIKGGVRRLNISDIYYVESQKHKLVFFTKEGALTTIGTMKELEKELSGLPFFRGHKGFLINLEHVDGVNDSCAIVNGEEIPVSRNRRKTFMEAVSNHWGEVLK